MVDGREELPRGVAVSRWEGAPPRDIEAGSRAHASIHVVVRGSFQLAQGEAPPLALEPGDVVLVGADRGGERKLRCIAGGVDGAPAELLSAAYEPARDPRLAADAPVVHLRAADVRRARGLSVVVSLLRAALTDPSAGQERLARSLLDPLLAYVQHGGGRNGAGDAREPADPRIARALQRLRERLADPWTVAALAKAAGLSRAAFARRFLAEIGVPPLRYLAELRMDRAARMLVEGDASLAFIAAEIGYESEFAFSRAFKRHTGEAPGVYRRRQRAERTVMRASAIRAAA
jgi:AraC-like DNA-binding protein